MIYTGELSVEPNEFNLRIDRMIVKPRKISFDCYGRLYSDRSPWNFSGVAVKQPEGHFKAEQVDDNGGIIAVYIFKPTCSVEACQLEGFWFEKEYGSDAEVWRFSGSLEPF